MINQPSPSSERMMVPDLMITGEAVALEVLPVPVGPRLLSGIVDYALYGAGLLGTTATVLAFITKVDAPLSEAAGVTLFGLITLAWLVVVPVSVEVLSRGRSAGRLAIGMRVVRDDGGAVRFRHCLVRTLVASIEVWLTGGAVALCACAVTRRGKRLGDLLAGTYVVREHGSSRDAAPLIMPPELAAWAAQADLRALPGNLALVSRTFLQRASTIRPDARSRLAIGLAAEAEPYVAPSPPAGTHPERFLAAILVARRDRELVLEMRDRRTDEHALAALDQMPHEVAPPR